MIYIVSGFARSGTAMMMQAAMAGGIPGVYSADSKSFDLKRVDWEALKLPDDLEGKVVKIHSPIIKKFTKGQARVVVMRRPLREISISFEKLTGHDYPFTLSPDRFEEAMQDCLSYLRGNAIFHSVDEFWYADVVKDPKAAFEKLKKSGWPIDVDEAAKIPRAVT